MKEATLGTACFSPGVNLLREQVDIGKFSRRKSGQLVPVVNRASTSLSLSGDENGSVRFMCRVTSTHLFVLLSLRLLMGDGVCGGIGRRWGLVVFYKKRHSGVCCCLAFKLRN